jgi:uncharacterized protein YodC (DUF2158 family)
VGTGRRKKTVLDMTKKFKVGDVVRLHSGGPNMTVEGYLKVMGKGTTEMKETTTVECRYYEGGTMKKASFEQDMLTLVNEKDESL